MGKPRCESCNKAMKRPHERVGAKGNWISIKQWWYCSNCDKMNKTGYQIPQEIEMYIDTIIGEKYPTISRIREQLNAPIYNIQELETAIETRNFDEKSSKFVKQENKLTAIWFCDKCEHTEVLSLDMISGLVSDEEFTKRIPIHCGQQMSLKVTSAIENMQSKLRGRLIEFEETLEIGDLEVAGIKFMEIFLNKFAYRSVKKAMKFYVKTARKEFSGFSDTFGFNIITLIIEAFIPETLKSIDDYNAIDLVSFKLRPDVDTATKLEDVFSDIQMYIGSVDPKQLPKFRKIHWTLAMFAKTWSKHRELIVTRGNKLEPVPN